MKKTLLIIITILLIAVPAGCSGQNKETSKYEAPTAAQTTSAQATAELETTAAPETTQEPTTALPETTAPLTAESYIKIYKEGSYYNSLLNEEDSYAMPLINIDSPDVNAINEQLISAYDECLNSFEAYQTKNFNDGVCSVSYGAWLNGDILSLCVNEHPVISEKYIVYNVDVNTGKAIDNSGIADFFGKSLAELHENIRSAIDNAYRQKFSGYVNTNGNMYPKTISDENVNAAQLFIKENNALYVMYDWYFEAQASHGQDVGFVEI